MSSFWGKALTDASSWDKRQFILDMPNWPRLCVLPGTTGQEALIKIHRSFYLRLSKWLEFYELGRGEFQQELFFGPLKTLKPYADISVTSLRFAQQVYPRLAWTQEIASSFENLWGQCEYFESQRRLRAGGFYGEPLTDDKGKVKSKTAAHKEMSRNIQDVRNALGEGSWENLRDNWPYRRLWEQTEDWREYLFSLVLHNAIIHAELHDDDELLFHCNQFLNAWQHFERLTNKEKGAEDYQFLYLPSPISEVQSTGKSRKARNPKAFTPITPKRSRGRPPKGSNVKKD